MTEAAKLDHRELLEQAAFLLSDHPLIACGLRGIAAELDYSSSDPGAVRGLEEIKRIIHKHVRSEADRHFVDKRWLTGVSEAAAEIAALRCQSPSATASEWQPIETAPKDGTHILAHRLPIGIRVTNLTNPPTVVHWFDDPDEPGFYTSVNERAPEHPFSPTHWRQLPAPPALTEKRPPSNQEGK